MKLSDRMGKGKVTLSFEVFPPKPDADFEGVKRAAYGVAQLRPHYVSVTYGAGGSTSRSTLEIAEGIQKEYGVPTVAHLTCVGATRASILEALEDMRARGIENVLALRGDRPAWMDGDPFTEYRYASELVRTIRSFGGFCIGGACYPEGYPDGEGKEKDILHLKEKVDAGCDFLTTQMFFDNRVFYDFLHRVRDAGIKVPVIPGIMPVTRASQVEAAMRLSGCSMPRTLQRMAERFGDSREAMRQAGILYASAQIADLIANGVSAIHVYSMNNRAVAEGLQKNLEVFLN